MLAPKELLPPKEEIRKESTGGQGGQRSPMSRVRSPQRGLRSGRDVPRTSDPQQHGSGTRAAGYVVATAHSPPPAGAHTTSSFPMVPSVKRPPARAASPSATTTGYMPTAIYRTASPSQHYVDRPTFHTPRSTSRQSAISSG